MKHCWEIQRLLRLRRSLDKAKYALQRENEYAKLAIPNGWPMARCSASRVALRERIRIIEHNIEEAEKAIHQLRQVGV